MNLTGANLYSRAASGLRQPGSKLLDQQFKLVFLYPMLFDNMLHGKTSETLRSFLSVSMLKEIFVSNALNIVATASKDHPLIDERGKAFDVQKMVNASIASRGSNRWSYDRSEGEITSSGPRFPVDSADMQRKINEKTAMIKKYLANEPRMKKLNAFVEIITLDNMIDVPVIVGTKDYQINTLTLSFVLATALALKKPLNSWTNAQFVFRVIENTKEDDAWQIFKSLVDKKQSSTSDRLINYLKTSMPTIASKLDRFRGSLLEPMSRFIKGKKKAEPKIRDMIKRPKYDDDPEVMRHQDLDPDKMDPFVGSKGGQYDPRQRFEPGSEFAILNVAKGKENLNQAKLFFKFMLDDDLLRNQFGLDRYPGQMKSGFTRISNHTQAVLAQSHQDFMSYMDSNVHYIMTQAFWSIHPWESDINYSQVKSGPIDTYLFNNVGEVYEEFGEALRNTFSGESPSSEKLERAVKRINQICDKNLEKVYSRIGELSRQMRHSPSRILSSRFNVDQFQQFYENFDDVVGAFSKINENLRIQIKDSFTGSTRIFKMIEDIIDHALTAMLDAYSEKYTSVGNDRFSNISVRKNLKPDPDDNSQMIPMLADDDIPTYLNEIKSGLHIIISAHFYATMLSSLCSFMEHIDVEIETVSNDALELPNYTLVIPVETVAMLHAAAVSKSWRDMVSGGNTQNTNLTDNYIKGIVKYVNKILEIPNLVVVDTKKSSVYYKFQYMSQVNKTNMRTFDTYVRNMTKQELQQGNLY